jgi:hypothetical protein
MKNIYIDSSRTTNSNVIDAWQQGRPAYNHKKTLATDGKSLFSYDLKIGFNTGSVCVVANFMAGSGHFRSQTTSCHVSMAKRATTRDMVWHPKVWECSPMSDRYPF